ncbi:Uncharacterised protein [uncultured archaeon]|nr:Uncharacterised protein [uncultured archaeon]
MKKNNFKGQVWIETVVYTLIGLAIMAILLSISMPQIEKIKDKSIITQTTDSLNVLNSKVSEAEEARGSIRVVNFKIAKGRLELNSSGNKVIYTLENTKLELSQIGESIKEGNVIMETKKSGDKFNIFLTMDYNNTLNLTYNGKKETKVLQAGTAPYKIILENTGYDASRKINIDFNLG